MSKIPPRGVEHPAKNPENTGDSETGGAKSGAPAAFSKAKNPDLRQVIEAWEGLPDAIRKAILAMVKAAKGGA